ATASESLLRLSKASCKGYAPSSFLAKVGYPRRESSTSGAVARQRNESQPRRSRRSVSLPPSKQSIALPEPTRSETLVVGGGAQKDACCVQADEDDDDDDESESEEEEEPRGAPGGPPVALPGRRSVARTEGPPAGWEELLKKATAALGLRWAAYWSLRRVLWERLGRRMEAVGCGGDLAAYE
ncbi:unnamed protein product, partial [Polarella glacialis]